MNGPKTSSGAVRGGIYACTHVRQIAHIKTIWTATGTHTRRAAGASEKLAGRDEVLRDFSVMIDRLEDGEYERSIVISGLRGVGKTVLLLDVIARGADWVSTDLRPIRGLTSGCRSPGWPQECCVP